MSQMKFCFSVLVGLNSEREQAGHVFESKLAGPDRVVVVVDEAGNKIVMLSLVFLAKRPFVSVLY